MPTAITLARCGSPPGSAGAVVAREGAADLVAVLLEEARLAREALDAGLPVGLVGVLRLDAQRHLLATAADPDLRELLDRLRVAVRAVERQVLALEGDGLLRPQPLQHLERLVEDLQPRACARIRDAVRLVLALVPARADAE